MHNLRSRLTSDLALSVINHRSMLYNADYDTVWEVHFPLKLKYFWTNDHGRPALPLGGAL